MKRGEKHSEETKGKMSLAKMGHKVSEETRRKIGEASKGRNVGLKHTEEALRKMRGMRKPLSMRKKGYYRIVINSKARPAHHVVWESVNGHIPRGYCVHHKDENKLNNQINNLQLMTFSDHRKYHQGYKKDEIGNWAFKLCFDCKELLPFDCFYKSARNGRMSRCIKCGKLYKKMQNNEKKA